jgi:putative serine protease PepD
MSGDEMADEDRSAASDDNRRQPDTSDSDWFFRERFSDPAAAGQQPTTAHQPTVSDPSGGPRPQADRSSAYYGPFGRQPAADEVTQVLPPYASEVAYTSADRYPAADPYATAFQPSSHSAGAEAPAATATGSFAAIPPAGPRQPPTLPPSAQTARARRPRTGLILLLAALLAALVGTAAGYAGARLAQTTEPAPAPAATPQARPSSPVSTGPQNTPVPAPPSQIDSVQVAAAALPSTVMIRVGSGGSGGTGSGFVLDTDGHIMTNNHVIADAADGGRITVVLSDGVRVDAELVGRSPSYDLAVIKLTDDHELTPMPVGDSEAVQVGEPVVAIGSPLALASTVTQGIVSAKNRPVVVNSDSGADSPNAYINGIQTDAAINPGNSGGPLVDAGARVIGVNSAILTLGGQSRDSTGSIGLGFAIPINQAIEIGGLLIKDGKATYPVIGVNVAEEDDDGVRLSEVDQDGPADKAGLQVDDVVVAIDDQPVTAPEELIVAIRTHRPGDTVTLTYERGGQRDTAEVTLGSREG